ncbi:reverse transcriptase domain-containing protein [Tanacetum coccineum]
MSNHEQPTPSHPKSDVRNTHYEKLLSIMADKYEYERRKKEKLEEVKARFDFGEARRKSTKARRESTYSRDLEAEDGVRPRTPIAVRNHSGSEAAAKTERWVMPTWCHMFNSTLTGNARVWFDDLPPESIDSYNDLREAFMKNYLQQKKCIRDPIVLHNIKQRDRESTEDFIQRYKSESGNVKGASKCMRISGFMHGITNPELIKRFHEKIPKTVDEMMQVATSFLQGQEATSNQERKKAPPA